MSKSLLELLDTNLSYDDIWGNLSEETDSFTLQEGEIAFDDQYETEIAISILKNHYEYVDNTGIDNITDDTGGFVIKFSSPIIDDLAFPEEEPVHEQLTEKMVRVPVKAKFSKDELEALLTTLTNYKLLERSTSWDSAQLKRARVVLSDSIDFAFYVQGCGPTKGLQDTFCEFYGKDSQIFVKQSFRREGSIPGTYEVNTEKDVIYYLEKYQTIRLLEENLDEWVVVSYASRPVLISIKFNGEQVASITEKTNESLHEKMTKVTSSVSKINPKSKVEVWYRLLGNGWYDWELSYNDLQTRINKLGKKAGSDPVTISAIIEETHSETGEILDKFEHDYTISSSDPAHIDNKLTEIKKWVKETLKIMGAQDAFK